MILTYRRPGPPDTHAMTMVNNVIEVLMSHLMEGIGINLDFKGNRMFITDLAGSIYSARLDGSNKRLLLAAQGNLTGIAYVETRTKENRHVI